MASAGVRILIVDDDAALLKVMGTYLSRLGYLVDACHSAAEAWALVRDGRRPYALALVDLNMSGMRGGELTRLILDSNASTRVVVASGYPAGWYRADPLDGDRVSFLHKPFAPKELADALQSGGGNGPPNCEILEQ